jgi:hypothetical protein
MVAPISSRNTHGTRPHSRTIRVSRPSWPSTFTAIAAGLLLLASPVSRAADSLATPIAGPHAEALWPIELELEISQLDALEGGAPRVAPRAPLASRATVVPDGHRSRFTSSVRTSRGQHTFTLSVVPRHHPGGAVELEWDLEVAEATYRELSVQEYLLHRLQLGPRPSLEQPYLKIARSDIVSTRGQAFTKIVEIGTQRYEIRIFAQSLRG